MMGQAVHGDISDGVGLWGGEKEDLGKWRMGHPRGGVKIFDKYSFSCVRGCLLKLFLDECLNPHLVVRVGSFFYSMGICYL